MGSNRKPLRKERSRTLQRVSADKAIEIEAIDGISGFNPLNPQLLGLPALDFEKLEDETIEEYQKRQDKALGDFITSRLKINKGGKMLPLRLIDKQFKFIADAFFERKRNLLLIKNRGGGGSLSAALIMWLGAVFQARSSIDIAGSKDQAQAVYNYTKNFWECVPECRKMLANDPGKSETILKNGVFIQAIPSSEMAARGKHPEILICDEACQADPGKDRVLKSALQVNGTHKNFTTILLSTFHVSGGLFDDYVSNYKMYGFTLYSWSIFDTLEKCSEALDKANEDDPLAIEAHCKKGASNGGCPLTILKNKINRVSGESVIDMIGCCGTARTANGFIPFDNALDMMVKNDLETFITEHGSGRPTVAGPVYDIEAIEAAITDKNWEIIKRYEQYHENMIRSGPKNRTKPFEEGELSALGHRITFGIDWGYVGLMTCIGPVIHREEHLGDFTDDGKPLNDICVIKDQGWQGTLVPAVIDYLNNMRKTYGHFAVFCDASHPYNNSELQIAGFEVYPIHFGKYKEYGVRNVAKFLEKGKMKIHPQCEGIISTIKKYRRDDRGRIIKHDDHYVDALMCAVFGFQFDRIFSPQGADEDINVLLF